MYIRCNIKIFKIKNMNYYSIVDKWMIMIYKLGTRIDERRVLLENDFPFMFVQVYV